MGDRDDVQEIIRLRAEVERLRAELTEAHSRLAAAMKSAERSAAMRSEAESKVERAEARLAKVVGHWSDTEARSAEAHAVYQKEAHRRGDVRHADSYDELPEPTKEWDRVLVRWVHATCAALSAQPAAQPEFDCVHELGECHGHCATCGLEVEENVTHECPPGFRAAQPEEESRG